jgi:hypothetical protein
LRCAQWHDTPRVLLRRCEPRAFAAGLRSALKNAALIASLSGIPCRDAWG